MKIGFTGTGGTGKSTTLNILKERGTLGVPVLPSVTREVFEEFGALEADQELWTPQQKKDLQMAIFKKRWEREEEYKETGFISDRTAIDHLAYCLHRCYEAFTDDEIEKLYEDTRLNMESYDLIFYFPIYFTPPSDGMRQTGNGYRKIIDYIIQGIIMDFDMPMVITTMHNDTAENWADFIEKSIFIMQKFGKDKQKQEGVSL